MKTVILASIMIAAVLVCVFSWRKELLEFLLLVKIQLRHGGQVLQNVRQTQAVPRVCKKYLDEYYTSNPCVDQDFARNLLRSSRAGFHNKTILMIGDSRIRQLFRFLELHFASQHSWKRLFYRANDNESFVDTLGNNTWQYLFNLVPNEETRQLIHGWTASRKKEADYLLYETGAWTVYRNGSQADEQFKQNLVLLASDLKETEITPIWIPTVPFHPHIRRKFVRSLWVTQKYNNTEELVANTGQIVKNVANTYNITVWTAAYRLAKNSPALYRDQLHPGIQLLRAFSCQLLLALDPRNLRNGCR